MAEAWAISWLIKKDSILNPLSLRADLLSCHLLSAAIGPLLVHKIINKFYEPPGAEEIIGCRLYSFD